MKSKKQVQKSVLNDKADMDYDADAYNYKKEGANFGSVQRNNKPRASNTAAMIKNKFKQMKSQEAIFDYYMNSQQVQQQQLKIQEQDDDFVEVEEKSFKPPKRNRRRMNDAIVEEKQKVPEAMDRAADRHPETEKELFDLLASVNVPSKGNLVPITQTMVDQENNNKPSSDTNPAEIMDSPFADEKPPEAQRQYSDDFLIPTPQPFLQAPVLAPIYVQETPRQNPLAENHEFINHDEYLRGITTYINMETDLKWYKLDFAQGTHEMGVIGIHITCDRLGTQCFKGNKYLIRAYNRGEQQLELPLVEAPEYISVHQTTIAWINRDKAREINIFEVGGKIVDTSYYYTKMREVKKIQHTLCSDQTPIQSFKILQSPNGENWKRISILTKSGKLHFIDFSLSLCGKNEVSEELTKFYTCQPETDFDIIQPMQYHHQMFEEAENEDDDVYEGFQEKLKLEHELQKKNTKVKRIIDYSSYIKQTGFDAEELNKNNTIDDDYILIQDSKDRLVLLKNQQQYEEDETSPKISYSYNYCAHIIMTDIAIYDQTSQYEVLDASIYQNSKIVFLIKITQRPNFAQLQQQQHQERQIVMPRPGQQQLHVVQQPQPENEKIKISYKMQVWDMMKNRGGSVELKSLVTYKLSSKHINEILKDWRKYVILDLKFRDIYIPDYKTATALQAQQINKICYTNSQQSIDSLPLNLQHIFDFVAQHHELKPKDSDSESASPGTAPSISNQKQRSQLKEPNKFKSGLLYSTFLIHQNLLIIGHGAIVTVIDLHDIQNNQRHMMYRPTSGDIELADKAQNRSVYSTKYNVKKVIFVDKDTLDVTCRWRSLVFFQDGQVQEIVRFSNLTKRQKKSYPKDTKENDLVLRSFIQESEYEISNSFPEQVNSFYSSPPQFNLTPLFLLNSDSRPKLAKLEPSQNKVRIYKDLPDISIDKSLFIPLSNNEDDLRFEYVMQINVLIADKDQESATTNGKKNQQKQADIEHIVRILKLYNHSNETDYTKREAFIIKEEVTPELGLSLMDSLCTKVNGDYVMFLHPGLLIKYSITYNQFIEIVKLTETLTSLEILDENFFYWRQFSKHSDFYMPLSSFIFFDQIDSPSESETMSLLKKRSLKLELSIFQGLYPHMQEICFDDMGQQFCTFIDYQTLIVSPWLHTNQRKLQAPGGKSFNETHILASKMCEHLLYTLHSDNMIRIWNMKSGNLVQVFPTEQKDYDQFKFHQKINGTQFILKRVRDPPKDDTLETVIVKPTKQQIVHAKMNFTPMMSFMMNDRFYIPDKITEDQLEDQDENEQQNNKLLQIKRDETSARKIQNQELLRLRYGIHIMDLECVDLVEYRVIEFACAKQDIYRKNSKAMKYLDSSKQNQIIDMPEEDDTEPDITRKVKLEVLFNFDAPNVLHQTNNFGLYASESMELFTFYYKDIFKNLQTIYYTLKPEKANFENTFNIPKRSLKLICKAIPNTWLSAHSTDFKYYLKQNSNEQLEVTPYDHLFKDDYNYDNYNMTVIFGKQAKTRGGRPETLEANELQDINLQIQKLNSFAPEVAPSFISKDKIAFMSPDNIILCFQVFEPENGETIKNVLKNMKTKEVFNMTQCQYPGSQKDIALDQIFLQDNFLIGENIFLMELRPFESRPQWCDQIIIPNFFNPFFQEQSYSDNDVDDAQEMRFIQNRYKMKIELLRECPQIGYVFHSRDYLSPQNLETSLYLVNTFSYFQWRALSLLKSSRLLVEDLSQNQLQSISYAQLPNGHTILNALKRNQESIRELFNTVYDREQDKEPFYVPILEDNQGETIFDKLLNKKKETSNGIDQVNVNVAFEILKNISDYPVDLFKLKLKSAVTQLIEADLLKFIQYLEHRIQQPSILTQVQYGKVQSDSIQIFTRDDLWCLDPAQILKNIESSTEYDLRKVDICLLDMHLIHLSKNHAIDRYLINIIYDKLAETDSIQVFQYNSVKALIEVKWRYIQKRIVYFLLLPYIVFMISFILYTTYDLEYFDSYIVEGRVKESSSLRIIIWILVTYFWIMEIRQIIISGLKKYITSAWNYMDLSLYTMVIVAEIIHGRFFVSHAQQMLDESDYIAKAKAVRTVYSFAAVIMWIRFLYFFRIFRNTGYYIKMLVQVMFDIRYFIFIFVLTIFSFAHAWFIYLKNNEDGPVFVSVNDALKYVYKIALGDFDTEIYGSYYQQISWLFFILATFILQIVLINLLISIVADTFSTIKSNYNVIMYQDMLHMIIENRFLAVGPLTEDLRHQYLFMALPQSTNSSEDSLLIGNSNATAFSGSQNSNKVLSQALKTIQNDLKDQQLKQNETAKRVASIPTMIEDSEISIMEKLKQMEERQLALMQHITQMQKSNAAPAPAPSAIPSKMKVVRMESEEKIAQAEEKQSKRMFDDIGNEKDSIYQLSSKSRRKVPSKF